MARKYSYEFKKYLVTVLENGIMSASELSRRCKIHKGVICNIYNRQDLWLSKNNKGIRETGLYL